MKEYSAFDIIGPVMVGPSSSHTAGAARLGKIAAIIAGDGIVKVKFMLHGSFAKTYKGHGTDKALVAGILGMEPWDENLKYSFQIAKERGIEIIFKETDLGDVHPNTVKFNILKNDDSLVEVMGSSIGGGNINVTEVNGQSVEFTGDYPTLLVKHKDTPGMISKVSTIISEKSINIAFLKVYRVSKGLGAIMVFQTDTPVPQEVIDNINSLGNIENISAINPIKRGE